QRKGKGIVQLSSATNSNSETLAATPKAVKA
nr:tail fiber protein [Escherichia coli]